MFHMMNEARIARRPTAATMLGMAGYFASASTTRATVRRVGPVTGAGAGGTVKKDSEQPQVPIIEPCRRASRMLLAQKSHMSRAALALELYCARLVDEQHTGATRRRPNDARAACWRMLTPIAKSWPSEWCLEANSHGDPDSRRLRLHT
jgi:hypothetical protein